MPIPIDPVAFTLGFWKVHWYGLILTSAIALGIYLSWREGQRLGLDGDFLLDAALVVIPASILGARFYEVFVLSWDYYGRHPEDILAVWKGGLAIHGGVLAGAAAGLVFAWRKKQPLWRWADVVAPYLILSQALGRWGNFINQEAYGAPIPLWLEAWMPRWLRDQMWIEGTVMHPAFLYESVWNVLGCLALLAFRRGNRPSGMTFFLYFVVYNLGRVAIESIRMDSSYLLFPGLRTAQVVAVLLILLGLAGMYWRSRQGERYEAPVGVAGKREVKTAS
ncbi:prolipoprotein diacylglyceryl transferase [Heliophilum fasciatum]|uniref:Phosphatidylglycerol--prolipoprotein diacylglyceryl transferase n=1 Tax=Heliophilum fasciatum TaxID=35700 RepID=A0A4R2RMJ6_9FIRM|nr:prolipoprotein diacylglyceryl transferase [Heliophilum fasciatum]MCW2278098.1 phosphatidylglycerol:prolipoprotein diacylglycerol transferase [Heliophilum fasciatum]TCP64168.1 prolipoprotein diacylglyceryl transferase [Heliophilum fasciatum]